jgi:opacity protein-like surface antigen
MPISAPLPQRNAPNGRRAGQDPLHVDDSALERLLHIRTGTAFTSYIGGGVGFAANQLTRSSIATDTVATSSFSASDRTTRINFAGAAMAGLTYDINSIVSLDVGYRFLYIGGTDIDLVLNGVNSDVTVGGISEHQIRAGLRFYID